MITLAVSVTLLILGYLVYGRVADRIFGMDPARVTPAFTKSDGIDYVPMKAWRVFMIQFLNIAGLGPIFGAILGAMYGPVVYIWIVVVGDVHGLNYAFTHPLADNPDIRPDPAWLVNEICRSWLGKAGAVIAVIGVVACPITSGDTAFRSARLTVADMFRLSQKKVSSRLLITIPVFAIGFILTFVMKDEFARIWKFVGISNQALAAITCWTIAMYLALRGKSHLFMSLPAIFLTAVCFTYILAAPHSGGGLAMPLKQALIIAAAATAAVTALFVIIMRRKKREGQ